MDDGRVTVRPSTAARDDAGGPAAGLLLAAGLAAASVALSAVLRRTPLPTLSPVFLAIVVGAAAGRFVGRDAADRLAPGLILTATRGLRVAIVLLGLRFSIGYALSIGTAALTTILSVVVTGLSVGLLAARVFGVRPRVGLLIGVGTAICGNSAITAIAPIVGADEEEISFASVVITGFGMLAMLVLPAIGRLLALDAQQFGVLAGAGVHDAAQAIAAGFLHSPEAGGIATVVKLARTGFLIPVVVVASLVVYRRGPSTQAGVTTAPVPLFVVGFVLAACLRSIGDRLLGDETVRWVAALTAADMAAGFLLAAAMGAIGARTRLRALRRVGRPASLAGLVASCACAGVALAGAVWWL